MVASSRTVLFLTLSLAVAAHLTNADTCGGAVKEGDKFSVHSSKTNARCMSYYGNNWVVFATSGIGDGASWTLRSIEPHKDDSGAVDGVQFQLINEHTGSPLGGRYDNDVVLDQGVAYPNKNVWFTTDTQTLCYGSGISIRNLFYPDFYLTDPSDSSRDYAYLKKDTPDDFIFIAAPDQATRTTDQATRTTAIKNGDQLAISGAGTASLSWYTGDWVVFQSSKMPGPDPDPDDFVWTVHNVEVMLPDKVKFQLVNKRTGSTMAGRLDNYVVLDESIAYPDKHYWFANRTDFAYGADGAAQFYMFNLFYPTFSLSGAPLGKKWWRDALLTTNPAQKMTAHKTS